MRILLAVISFTFLPSAEGFVSRNVVTFHGRPVSFSTEKRPSTGTGSLDESKQNGRFPTINEYKRSETFLKQALNQDIGDKKWDSTRIGAVVALSLLLAFVFVSPGTLADPADIALISKIVEDPVNPGINPLYYTFFNVFSFMPVVLAAIAAPQASSKGVPPWPFLMGSVFLGYFAFGPYLILRQQPPEMVSKSDLNSFTRNVLENKLFAVFTLLFSVVCVVAPDAVGAYQADPTGTWQGFVDLVSSSKFCSVSLLDLTMLYIFITVMTHTDYKLRKPDATNEEAWKIAGLSALLPFVGSAIYMTLRPAIPED